MASKAALAKSVLRSIEEGIAGLAFSKKRGGGFSREIEQDTFGYVGLNLATNLPDSRIGVSPIVGVTFKPIEDLVRKLANSSPFLNDVTLTTAVGYLTPEKRFLQWVFDQTMNATPEIARIIRAIQEYGLPFMREHTTLNSFVTDLEENRFTVNDTRRYRLPVAYLLVGRREEGLKFVEQELEAMRERTDPAALQYRGFAQAFQQQ